MVQLEAARNVAIGLGGSITPFEDGFLTCFDSEKAADAYLQVLNGFNLLSTRSSNNCVVVTITVA